MDALDLVQFYWHDYSAPKYVDAAQRLAELQGAGKIRHIGVTNFDVPRLDEIVHSGVRVVSNQVRSFSRSFIRMHPSPLPVFAAGLAVR